MKRKKIGYWLVTILFCMVMTAGGVGNLVQAEPQQQMEWAYAGFTFDLIGMPVSETRPGQS